MANLPEYEKAAIEIHDDGSKELDAGLRPLDHYKQVKPLSWPVVDCSGWATNFHFASLCYR